MLRCLSLIVVIIMSYSISYAQDNTASQTDTVIPSDFVMRMVVDSLNIRALPTTDSERVGSLFEGDNVYAVGRNIDGTWFEIQRPSKSSSAGWVSRDYFAYMFDATTLPITDLTTGIIGDVPVIDTGASAFILTESALRTEPRLNADIITNIPVQRTIPVLARTPDNLWLQINYLGQVGWVAEFLVNVPSEITVIPVDNTFVTALSAPLPIIPPEVQRAQAQRFIDYATPIRTVAGDVALFWSQLSDGLTIPCNPITVSFNEFRVTQQDLFELPELRRANRLMPIAIGDLNASIAMMQSCGIYTPNQISNAYADALNAQIILDSSIDTMNFVIEEIIGSSEQP